jgi:ATP-binding cassette subfamily B protein
VVAAASCAVAVQYGMKLIVDAMNRPDRSAAPVEQLLAIFIALIGIESLLWRAAGVLGCRSIVATGVDLRLDLFEHLTGHSMRFFATQLSGSLGGRITATTGAAGAIFSDMVWRITPPVVDFLGALVVFVTIDAPMAGLLAAFVLLASVAVMRVGVSGRPLHQAYAEQAARVNGELVDIVTNVWTVKAFSARRREWQRLAHEFGMEASAQRSSWLYLERVRGLHDLLLLVMAGAMLVWSITLWRHGRISPGDVVVVSALTFRILHGSRDLALALVDTSQHLGAIREILKVIGAEHLIRDREGAGQLDTAQPALGVIEFRNVRFGYDEAHPVFKGLDLRIEAGQTVGVVGPSGAGKSTLLALIQRLEEVQGGAVLIGGRPITDYTQDSLRMAIGVVPQEIALLHRSVRENIRYGRPEASDEAVRQAARRAHCLGFIEALPQGFDTLVGERGTRLSGGQRQRIGIARAFLKDAPILILDESTSALDSESERDVHVALDALRQGRTVVSVAHRLSSLSRFERIIVLVDGRVHEDGTLDELRGAGGLFERMWRLQTQEVESITHRTPEHRATG